MPSAPRVLPTLVAGCLLALVAALGLAVLLPRAAASASSRDAVTGAWQLAQDSGTYRFRSELRQTATQAPSLRSAGSPPREDQLTLEGKVDQPAEALELTLWRGAAGDPATGISIRVADGRALGRQGQGEWQELDSPAELFAPGGDPLGFLAGARDFTDEGAETRELAGATLRFTRYGFRLDGPAFAEAMRARLADQLRRQGKLPPGMQLQSADTYRRMTGQGTLWVDADGLPRRLELRMSIPGELAGAETSATVVSDFLDFDRAHLALATTSLFDSPTAWLSYNLELHGPALRELASGLALALAVGLLLLLSVSLWRRRPFQTALALAVISSLLCSPLFQAQQIASAAESLAARQSAQQAAAESAAAQAEAVAAVRAPAIDPHVAPLAAPNAVAAATVSTDTTDSDGDGLTDDEEALYGTCARSGASSGDCAGVASSLDSDADGIGDAIEVKTLGSDPDAADSDGDGISDYLEVNGFTSNGKSWYLDPNAADTNGDGLLDSVDCPIWSAASSTYNPAGVCPNTDGDGTPDVWDDDDDADGVLDAVDLSPSARGGIYDDDTPLQIGVSDLQLNTPVFVDLQLRPTDARQLSYISSMLDWPSGDEKGQIQRRLDTTFATTSNSSLLGSDAAAAYGDIRIVPMLEVSMPAGSGHYANLPVTSAYQGVARPAGVAADTWIDSAALDAYGITVRDVDSATGELVAYLPLSQVYDDVGGGLSAYQARMLYRPSVGSGGVATWGATQEYRLIWLVQMLSDECIDDTADEDSCAREDSLEVIHVYRDENWRLAGLEVREDHGLDVAILYENPAGDDDRTQDDDLWAASWNLNNTWLRGRDCGTSTTSCSRDGTRDVSLANMEAMLDSWSANGDAIEARSFSYDHQGYISHVMMTETADLLGDVFTPYAATVDPTLLFAREETFRSLNLEALASTSGALSFGMTTSAAPTVVQAAMSWSTYQYSDGAWENYDATQNLERLAGQLASISYFQPADSSEDAIDAAEGKLIWAQLYYSSLAAGLTSVVSSNGKLLFTPAAGDVPETDYSAQWPANLGTGAGFVGFSYLEMLIKAFAGNSETTFWQNLRNAFETPSATQYMRQNFKYGGVASNVMLTATTASVVAGMGLFLAGFFSGDAQIQQIGAIVLTATTATVSLAAGINLVTGMARAASAATGFAGTLKAMSGVTAANRAIGPVGLLIGVGVVWGLFVVQGLAGGLFSDPDSIGFNSALAYAIAGTIVLMIMFVLDLIPIVGTLIVLTIYIVDVFLTWFCKTTCHGGAQAWLTEVIADSLYSVDDVLANLDSPERLDFNISDVSFSSDSAGFTTANAATFTVAVTNTLRYASGFGDDDANRATFRYTLEPDDDSTHALALGEMRNEWSELGGRYLRTTAEPVSQPVAFSAVRAGVNRSLGGQLYLAEHYVGPYAGCWLAFGINTGDCNFFPYSGTNNIDLGSYIVYDILPSSLTTLLLMGWNRGDAMPAPMDPDGDGLVSMASGGSDPSNLSWDADNDGLSDEYELNNLLNPADTDSDDDGLSDLFEARRSLNPLAADSDDDGLSDSQEQTGWRIGYRDQSGVQRYSWVWSDPFAADADADNLNDLEEFYYGFHPGVATDNDLILNTITFDNSSLQEADAPLLLARFEEESGAVHFTDDSGDDRALSCDEASNACPGAAVSGRYGSALQFDGANDYLSTDLASIKLAKGSFTLSAWVKTSGTRQAIITKSDGDSSWELGEKSFYLDGSGRPTFVGWGNNYINSTSAVNDGAWHHVAVTWSYTSGSSGSGAIYVDGVSKTGTVSYAANNADKSGDSVWIGLSNRQFNEAASNFSGTLDEVAMFDRALSATQVSALMSARYNADDGAAVAGAGLNYTQTINNNSGSWPVQATYYGELDESYTGSTSVPPTGEWKLDETSGTSFADSSGHGYSATCTTCPTPNAAGYRGRALQFDGVDDQLVLDSASRAASAGTGFSFGGWVYPTGTDTAKRYQVVFAHFEAGTTFTQGGTLGAIYYSVEDKAFFGDSVPNTGTGSAPPNAWYHVMITVDPDSDVARIYLNGVLKATNKYGNAPDSLGRFRVGGPTYNYGSTNQFTFHSFVGRVDGITLYDRRLTKDEIVQVMAGTTTLQVPVEETSSVYTVPVLSSSTVSELISIPADQPGGAYRSRHVTEAALDVTDETNSGSAAADPDTTLLGHYNFDDPPGDSTISDSARRLGDLTCTGTACPALGIRGMVNRAARFDGDDLVSISGLDTLYESYSVAAWVKARDGIIVENQNGVKSFRLWTDRYDYRSKDYNTYHLGYELPSTTEWAHVVVTYNHTNNANAIYIDGALASTPGGQACCNGTGINQRIKLGELLDGYLDDVRIYSRALTASEAQTLYATSTPQLQLEFEEASDATSFEDSSQNSYDATLMGAGAGLPGRIGTGGYFDGSNGYARISSAPVIGQLTSGLSVMAWVKPDSLSGTQRFIASGRGASNNGLGFGMQSGKLLFSAFGVRDFVSSAGLTLDTWQHVAVVFDANYDARFYLNGAYVDTVAGTAALLANNDDGLYIGAGTASGGSTASERFSGMLDELFVNNRALGDAEIERSYYNQFRWFRKQHDSYLTIDTDSPTIKLLTGEYSDSWGGYWLNAPVQLVVSASDPTSQIWSFEYGLMRHNANTMVWQSAPRCAGSDEALWCPSFDPRTLDGQGIYALKFRAVDAVGNQTTTDYFPVVVDVTPPTATASYNSSRLTLTPDPASELSWSVSLAGSLKDPELWRTGDFTTGAAGRIDGSSIAVSLIDATGAAAGMGAQYATIEGEGWHSANWSIDYQFVGVRPSGVYTVRVSAADHLGNSASTDVGTIILDARAPSVQLEDSALLAIVGRGATLSGVLSEQAARPGAVLSMHFEEPSGTNFADYSGDGNTATCTNCPARVAGVFGQALALSKADTTGLTVPYSASLDLSVGTLSAWVKPTWAAGANGYNPGILGVRGSGGTRFSWHIRDDYSAIDLYNGDTVGSLPISITPGAWHHLALVQEGSQWTGYLDGVALGTVSQPFGTQTGLPLMIGASGGGEHFSGSIDEVALYDRALSAAEIYALAQREVSGASSAELSLTPFSPQNGAGAQSWRTLTVDQAGASLSTWSYAVPNDLEGFFQIQLRGSDAEGNRSEAGTVWSGAIDTKLPRLTASAQQRYGGAFAVTEYTLSAEDLFLDPASIGLPCVFTAVTGSDTESGRVNAATATCSLPGHISAPSTLEACDYAGNCAALSVTPTVSAGEPAISFATPASSAFIGTAPITLGGEAYAGGGIQAVRLSVNGVEVGSQSFDSASEGEWSIDWTPPAGGSYSLTATVQSVSGTAAAQRTITVEPGVVEVGVALAAAPALIETGDVVTYTLQFSNTGTIAATDVIVSLPLPEALSDAVFRAVLDSGSATQLAGADYRWSISKLAPGAGGTITVTGRLNAAPASTVEATATISAADDAEPANNGATASIGVAERVLSYAVSAPTSVSEGGELRITFSRSRSDVASQVRYTLGGTAAVGSDYSGGEAGFVSFAEGVSAVSVGLTTIDDTLVEGGETITLTLSDGSDPKGGTVIYSPAGFTAAITDNDTDPGEESAGLTLGATTLSMEQGAQQAVTLSLNSRPTAAVQISLSSSASSVCSVSPSNFMIAAADWALPASFTVTAVAAGTCTISVRPSGADPRYAALSSATLEVTVSATTSNVPWRVYLPMIQR